MTRQEKLRRRSVDRLVWLSAWVWAIEKGETTKAVEAKRELGRLGVRVGLGKKGGGSCLNPTTA